MQFVWDYRIGGNMITTILYEQLAVATNENLTSLLYSLVEVQKQLKDIQDSKAESAKADLKNLLFLEQMYLDIINHMYKLQEWLIIQNDV